MDFCGANQDIKRGQKHFSLLTNADEKKMGPYTNFERWART